MKKISILAVIVLIMTLTCSCAKMSEDKAQDQSDPIKAAYNDSLEVINKVWDAFADEDRFSAGGGSSDNLSTDGPAKFDHKNKDELAATLALPDSLTDKIDDAASLTHMMNSNMFTAGAYRLKEGVDAKEFAKEFEKGLSTRQWLCGFPEKYAVVNTTDYVIAAFGSKQNIDAFTATATKTLDSATVIADGSIEL